MKSPTQIVWEAAGRPRPCDVSGTEIAASHHGERCAKCGTSGAEFDIDDFISSSFVPTRNANRIGAFEGRVYCAACTFCARTLRLRCISWFASSGGFRFWPTRPAHKDGPRPDALSALLDPPRPPFVVGIPLYGIAHGGENNWRRTWWPGERLPTDPLTRLQSKHVAIYARAAFSRDQYPVQVDDQLEFYLDRDAWLRAQDDALALLRAAITDGTKPYPARLCLEALRPPSRASSALARAWPRLAQRLQHHHEANWWPLFCELIQVPEESTDATTRSRTDTQGHPADPSCDAPPSGVSTAGERASSVAGEDRGTPIQLALW